MIITGTKSSGCNTDTIKNDVSLLGRGRGGRPRVRWVTDAI